MAFWCFFAGARGGWAAAPHHALIRSCRKSLYVRGAPGESISSKPPVDPAALGDLPVILDEGYVNVAQQHVRVFLITQPLVYPGCEWEQCTSKIPSLILHRTQMLNLLLVSDPPRTEFIAESDRRRQVRPPFSSFSALFSRQLLIRAADVRRSLYNRDHEQLVGTPSASSDKPLFADDADGRMSAPSSPAKRRPDSIVSSAPDATPISGSSGSRKNVDPTFRHFIKKMAKDEAKHLVTAVRGFIASFKEAQWGPEECGERVQRFYQVNICPPRFDRVLLYWGHDGLTPFLFR